MKLRKGNRAPIRRRSRPPLWERVKDAGRSAWKMLHLEVLIAAVLVAAFGFGMRAPSSLKEMVRMVWMMILNRR